MFAVRGGFLGQSKFKGSHRYFTTGAGVRLLDCLDVDVAYIIPVYQDNPSNDMYRISLSANLNTAKK